MLFTITTKWHKQELYVMGTTIPKGKDHQPWSVSAKPSRQLALTDFSGKNFQKEIITSFIKLKHEFVLRVKGWKWIIPLKDRETFGFVNISDSLTNYNITSFLSKFPFTLRGVGKSWEVTLLLLSRKNYGWTSTIITKMWTPDTSLLITLLRLLELVSVMSCLDLVGPALHFPLVPCVCSKTWWEEKIKEMSATC